MNCFEGPSEDSSTLKLDIDIINSSKLNLGQSSEDHMEQT